MPGYIAMPANICTMNGVEWAIWRSGFMRKIPILRIIILDYRMNVW